MIRRLFTEQFGIPVVVLVAYGYAAVLLGVLLGALIFKAVASCG